MRFALLLTWAFVLLLAGSAGAVTVTGYAPGPYGDDAGSLLIYDEKGQSNQLLIQRAGRKVTVRERRATSLSVAGECKLRSTRVAECPAIDLFNVVVDVGIGRDEIVAGKGVYGDPLTLIGGAGGDRLVATRATFADLSGGPGSDELLTGPGDDTLSGGEGNDVLRAGAGDDALAGEGPGVMPAGRDLLDGGSGTDIASWRGHSAAITVDLGRQGRAGSRGEGDEIRGIEEVEGGGAPDLLLGTSGPDGLFGGKGRDRLVGGAGSDTLAGGLGLDRLGCGRGQDRVVLPAREVLPKACELFALPDTTTFRPHPTVIGPFLRVPIYCDSEVAIFCRRSVTVRRSGQLIGRSRVVRMKKSSGRVLVRLRGAVLPGRSVEIRVTGFDKVEDPLTDSGYARDPFKFAYRVRL